jgi:SAM-dependent methyltransferase
MIKPYNNIFYRDQSKGSELSAMEMVPYFIELLKPKSVIDFGCGVGTWLKQFFENGISDIIGLDGNWVKKDNLLIPKEKFIGCDLKNQLV